VKKIVSAGKSLVKGVKKAFKEVTKSKIGKALLIAATIYVGGGMLGAWNTPFSSINGILAKGGGQAAAKAGESTAQSFLAGSGTEAAAVAAPTGFTPSVTTAATSTGTGSINLGAMGAQAGTNAAVTGGQEVAKQGMLKSAMAKTGEIAGNTAGWMAKNPVPSFMAMNAITAAMSPDEVDLMREQSKILEEREAGERERRERNLSIAGIDIGVKPSGKPLVDMSGNPIFNTSGMLNRARYS
jgi:hypothetical protein